MAIDPKRQGNTMMVLRQKLYKNLARIDYARLGLYAALVALVVGGSYYGYRWYTVRREQAAQKIFADCMQEYSYAQVGQEKWESVEQLCKRGYEQASSSRIAPYFLALQSDALMYQHKKSEALELLNTMLNGMSKKSPLYATYATKRALLGIDMEDAHNQKLGLEQLTALANDTANSNRDAALYYLGLYYWSHDEVQKGQEIWQQLLTLAHKDQSVGSPWATLAHQKMQPLK